MKSTQKRRILERLEMARLSAKSVEESLAQAVKLTEEDSEEQESISTLCIVADNLRVQIEVAQSNIQGE